jgi:hypothetical protein
MFNLVIILIGRKFKAELSSLPAQTKLMPFGYKKRLSGFGIALQ